VEDVKDDGETPEVKESPESDNPNAEVNEGNEEEEDEKGEDEEEDGSKEEDKKESKKTQEEDEEQSKITETKPPSKESKDQTTKEQSNEEEVQQKPKQEESKEDQSKSKSEEESASSEEKKNSESPKEETKELDKNQGKDSDSSKKQSDAEESKSPEERPLTIKRKSSKFKLQRDTVMYRPEFIYDKNESKKDIKMWDLMSSYLGADMKSIQRQIINHVEYTLARNRFTFDNNGCYYATAYSVRDRLVESWNDTQQQFCEQDPKTVYFMSMEYLFGRMLQNALVNTGQETHFNEALEDIGYDLKSIYEEEHEPGLGNGGIGILAACLLDSLTTLEYPAWGYGMRYSYGAFKQEIRDGCQFELPDYWLGRGDPWEIERLDVIYPVKFYGNVKTYSDDRVERKDWEGGENVVAMGYDIPIPGYNTFNTNNLRLWRACPSTEFDFKSFNVGDYFGAVKSKQRAESISSVLYPNDSTMEGKELRLKQEYFFCAATLQDILGRFVLKHNNWEDFPKKVAIHLNGSNPGLTVVELMRQLVDKYKVSWDRAWDICCKTFSYTNHIGKMENLEKWDVGLLGKVLPRHLDIIYLINHNFLENVKKACEGCNIIRDLSLIEEGNPKKVRMSHLCILASHKVNGVSHMQTVKLKEGLFKDFVKYYEKCGIEPENKFINITSGVTPRRWLVCANPELSDFITKKIGDEEWITNYPLVKDFKMYADEEEVIDEFKEIRKKHKVRLAEWVKNKCNGLVIDPNSLFDVFVKQIEESKRQLMAALYIAYRYFWIKEMQADAKASVVPRTFIFGGKADPSNSTAKNIIKLINMIAKVINEDPDVNQLIKVVYLPNYSVSVAQLVIPAADVSQHIATTGTEACGTSVMKFAMNGCLILGTLAGSTAELAEELGKENVFTFGSTEEEVEKHRAEMRSGKRDYVPQSVSYVIEALRAGRFGKLEGIEGILNRLVNGGDYYVLCWDFFAYMECQSNVDECYQDKKEWIQKVFTSIACAGKFSSDRTIREYSEKVW
jgi:starch phosphorylase